MKRWSRGRVALVGDAAFCVSLMAGQGSALATTGAYVMAGELTKAPGRHEGAFRNYEAILHGYIGSKQKRAERFSSALYSENPMGCVHAQSIRHSRTGEAGVRVRHCRQTAAARLPLAVIHGYTADRSAGTVRFRRFISSPPIVRLF
jgi:2-polyprenyl-6-methoxyphenol hydroxylase-like FAD-dependent oxidoreductase